ncbi:glycosyltransferase family 2 protein [Meiothermus taiwanensis]|jgi:GT2 family glycosyltransferase|uniref:Glycosyl transferase family 2 n=1 Tax=Meiothermus taiwanensis WR-220 TaxID=1339250 RepID=A0ABN5LU96_9DEIN|nr:glycosyltransferase family 2 protein [Meiothermus taiwanensis]AWR85423.1 glycosyl transferase family 2 [Meiothermus taiwanensis WR-220]KIQ53998.1 glycosyl transferase family 2 [Meiothermus taiwanensis]KZK16822.1 glycosyl transferase family 2 [Meiothermus taiwanensis]
MAEPLVYTLILNYRTWRDTLVCLGALKRLEYPNHRVLVLDNASDDDSIDQIRAAFPAVELVRLERNLGFAGGNNVGIRRALAAGADYVWLLNPDTLPDAKALSAMVQRAEQDARIGAVGAVLYEMDNPQQVQAWGGGEVVLPWGLIRLLTHPRQLGRLNYISGASLLIRRTALERVGLLDEGFFMYGEDCDYGLRLLEAGFRLAVAEEARVLHKGGSSWSGNLRSDETFAAYNVRLFRKHAPWPLLAVAGYGLFWLLEYSRQGRFDKVGALGRGLRRGWRLPLDV